MRNNIIYLKHVKTVDVRITVTRENIHFHAYADRDIDFPINHK